MHSEESLNSILRYFEHEAEHQPRYELAMAENRMLEIEMSGNNRAFDSLEDLPNEAIRKASYDALETVADESKANAAGKSHKEWRDLGILSLILIETEADLPGIEELAQVPTEEAVRLTDEAEKSLRSALKLMPEATHAMLRKVYEDEVARIRNEKGNAKLLGEIDRLKAAMQVSHAILSLAEGASLPIPKYRHTETGSDKATGDSPAEAVAETPSATEVAEPTETTETADKLELPAAAEPEAEVGEPVTDKPSPAAPRARRGPSKTPPSRPTGRAPRPAPKPAANPTPAPRPAATVPASPSEAVKKPEVLLKGEVTVSEVTGRILNQMVNARLIADDVYSRISYTTMRSMFVSARNVGVEVPKDNNVSQTSMNKVVDSDLFSGSKERSSNRAGKWIITEVTPRDVVLATIGDAYMISKKGLSTMTKADLLTLVNAVDAALASYAEKHKAPKQ